jgi:peptidoglycan hydrolase-like protein with peptidoglycan-binding domain
MRPARAAAGALAAATLAAGGLEAWALGGPDPEPAGAQDGDTTTPTAANGESLGTAEVTRADLRTTEELDGELGYGDTSDLPNQAQGTLTWAPAAGTILDPGAIAYEVDEQPVVVMRGSTPAWRTMARNVDVGVDVAQLQQFLLDAGFADPEDVTADGDFDYATQQAVKAFQNALGVDDTGVIELGSVIFTPFDLRVAETPSGVGSTAGASVLTVTGVEQVVTVDLDASDADLLPVGAEVEVELPNGEIVAATVSAVATTAVAGEDGADGSSGDTTVAVTLQLAQPVTTYVEAPVEIEVVKSEAAGVLAVPVGALLALAEGGYALEVVDGTGATQLVAVEIGEFADGLVEVQGAVEEGDTVVVPA